MKNILVVVDDYNIRNLLFFLLQKPGYGRPYIIFMWLSLIDDHIKQPAPPIKTFDYLKNLDHYDQRLVELFMKRVFN